MRIGLDSCGLPEAGDPAINVPGRKKVLYLNRPGVLRSKNLWRGGLFRLPWLLFIVFVVPRNETSREPLCQDDRPHCSCWKPSVRAPKVSSCFEFASDLRNVAALKARARKFVLRRQAAAIRFSDRRCAVRRTTGNLIHCALPLK